MELRKRSLSSMDGHIVPEYASFFEVADPTTEAKHEEPSLALPKAFIKRFHTFLSQTLVLETPTGEIWKARLKADAEKRLRITSGWKNLADSLNVQSGDLLVLDLISKGHFRVYIYEGEDMCEKNLQKEKGGEPGDKYMHATSTPEFVASAKKRKEEAVCECKVHHTSSNVGNGKEMHPRDADKLNASQLKEAENIGTQAQNIWSHTHGPLPLIPYDSSSKVKKMTKSGFTLTDLHEILPNFHKKTQTAFKAALSYSSKNPFTITTMGHSNVCHGFKMGFSMSFARQHMGPEPEHVALIDTENKAWSVTWLGYNNGEAVISGGWKHFAMDHCLKCGDICVFEKGNTKALPTFKVTIFKIDTADGPVISQIIPLKLSDVIARGYR